MNKNITYGFVFGLGCIICSTVSYLIVALQQWGLLLTWVNHLNRNWLWFAHWFKKAWYLDSYSEQYINSIHSSVWVLPKPTSVEILYVLEGEHIVESNKSVRSCAGLIIFIFWSMVQNQHSKSLLATKTYLLVCQIPTFSMWF